MEIRMRARASYLRTFYNNDEYSTRDAAKNSQELVRHWPAA